jgi:hypothetical protein
LDQEALMAQQHENAGDAQCERGEFDQDVSPVTLAPNKADERGEQCGQDVVNGEHVYAPVD